MKNKKGFTLIEVIIALALIGIITVGFVAAMGNYFLFFNKTEEISRSIFRTQQQMEISIDEVKKGIRDNKESTQIAGKSRKTTPAIWKSIDNRRNSPGVQINYFEVEELFNNKPYITLISNIKPEIDDNLLELHTIGILSKKGNNDVPYVYSSDSYSILGNFENDRNTSSKYNHLLNVVDWYASSSGFNMPVPSNVMPNEEQHHYPVFPVDYKIIKTSRIDRYGKHLDVKFIEKNDNTRLEDYRGRHIIFAVTPGAKSGKIGIQSVSRPVFISGIPIVDNLDIHLDASFTGSNSLNEFESRTRGGETTHYVTKWNDISSAYTQNDFEEAAVQATSNKRPQLLKTDREESFIGQFVKFNSNQELEIENQNTSGKNIYVFAAVRNDMDNIVFLKNGNRSIRAPLVVGENKVGDWIIVKENYRSNNNTFNIGAADIDIAEIAVYTSKPDGKDEETFEQEILGYFLTKYRTNVLVDNGDIRIIVDEE